MCNSVLFRPGACAMPYDKIPRMRRLLIVLLASMLLVGCSLPALAVPTRSPEAGSILFKDDFSSPASGWDHTKYAEGVMDYDGGGYRMLVKNKKEPWGQTVSRFIAPEGLLVGITFTPWLRDKG